MLLSCRAKHINHLAALYNLLPLALLPILGYQPTRIYSEGKKKGSQQHDSAEGTSRQSRKLRRILFGAVSRFLENTQHISLSPAKSFTAWDLYKTLQVLIFLFS